MPAPSRLHDARCHTEQPWEEHCPLLSTLPDGRRKGVTTAGFIYQWSQQETSGDSMWFVTSTEAPICKVTKVRSPG